MAVVAITVVATSGMMRLKRVDNRQCSNRKTVVITAQVQALSSQLATNTILD